MKKTRFTETQIVSNLKEVDAGHEGMRHLTQARHLDRELLHWKSKYGGMEASELKRMKELETALSQYKRMYAELAHSACWTM